MQTVTAAGRSFVLAQREQLRRRSGKRMFRIGQGDQAPEPPHGGFNWSKDHTLKFPILGNDRVGDCYYAAACHFHQATTGCVGVEAQFDAAAVVARYRVLSGGDNGLGDEQIMPEMRAGIVGPKGPYKIADDLILASGDHALIRKAIWLFGPAMYTASLLDTWTANPHPGQVWTSGGRADPNAGHAIILSGVRADGNYDLETWGFSPPVILTPSGMAASDPEVWVSFALSWFNDRGYAPNGFHYVQLAAWWHALGGQQLPPSPFPAPTPSPAPPNPVPPMPNDSSVYDVAGALGPFRFSAVATPRTSAAPVDVHFHHVGLWRPPGGWIAVGMDAWAVYQAIDAKNIPGLMAAAQKLLTDLGIGFPPKLHAAAIPTAQIAWAALVGDVLAILAALHNPAALAAAVAKFIADLGL